MYQIQIFIKTLWAAVVTFVFTFIVLSFIGIIYAAFSSLPLGNPEATDELVIKFFQGCIVVSTLAALIVVLIKYYKTYKGKNTPGY
jgi:nucleoside permease NupC